MLLSGGIDSATALFLERKRFVIRALTFEFRGISRSEVVGARRLAALAGVKEHRMARLPDLAEAEDMPHGRFEGMPGSYIPGRNGIFYSYAASVAEEVGASLIVGGHNKDDQRTFPDSRPAFFRILQRALKSGSKELGSRDVKISLPLASMTKAEVVKLAQAQGVPLGMTWSCHRDTKEHCWTCEGCLARVRAFDSAGVEDPLRL